MTAERITYDRRPAGTGIKSRYAVLADGIEVGEVWQLQGRSFSGAWWASSSITGHIVSRCASRQEAATRIIPEPAQMPALCFHTSAHCGATATRPCSHTPRRRAAR